MTWRNGTELQAKLWRAAAVPPPEDKEAFWRHFYRRAAVRLPTPADGVVMVGALGWRWAWAAMAVLAVTIVAALWLNPNGGDGAAAGTTPGWGVNEDAADVTLVNVNVPCRGVVVVRDAADRGTVVWVAGISKTN